MVDDHKKIGLEPDRSDTDCIAFVNSVANNNFINVGTKPRATREFEPLVIDKEDHEDVEDKVSENKENKHHLTGTDSVSCRTTWSDD